MFARVFSAQVKAGELDTMSQLVESSIIPAANTQPGFKGLLFLIDRSAHKAMLVSQWASEADRAASESNGFLREQLGKLAALVAGPPSTERFEISARE
jgi:heme-degrading monooxygenase HmoA